MTIRDNGRILPGESREGPTLSQRERTRYTKSRSCATARTNVLSVSSQPRSCAAARANGLSVPSATRRKSAESRPIDWAPLPDKYLYLICRAQLRRTRAADSDATRSARVPKPQTWADVNESDAPSDGASLPCPNASSSPDVLVGGECYSARNNALRNSTNGARRKSSIHGHATKISLRANDGSRLILFPSVTASRHFAESNQP